MKKCIVFLILHLIVIGSFAQDKKELYNTDGPYVLYEKEGVRIIQVDKEGALHDTIWASLPPKFSFNVVSEDGKHSFPVQLHLIKRQEWKYKQPEKVFVISDPHADIDCFVSILKAGNVINDQYQWIYGKNHLVIIGDVFDRGKGALPIYWLIYKLDQEASNKGGRVSFLPGNHEEMVLRNNLKYTDEKYKVLAEKLKMPYNSLWHENSELGRWLKTRNTMEIIGSDLYVHAGLSPELLTKNWVIPEINDTISRYLFESKEERSISPAATFLFGDSGPLWYRGMVLTDEKYNPITEADLSKILETYHAKRIFVGHTIFEDITSLHGGRVIAVNVSNRKNMEAGKGRGVFIEKKNTYVVKDNGSLQKME